MSHQGPCAIFGFKKRAQDSVAEEALARIDFISGLHLPRAKRSPRAVAVDHRLHQTGASESS